RKAVTAAAAPARFRQMHAANSRASARFSTSAGSWTARQRTRASSAPGVRPAHGTATASAAPPPASARNSTGSATASPPRPCLRKSPPFVGALHAGECDVPGSPQELCSPSLQERRGSARGYFSRSNTGNSLCETPPTTAPALRRYYRSDIRLHVELPPLGKTSSRSVHL